MSKHVQRVCAKVRVIVALRLCCALTCQSADIEAICKCSHSRKSELVEQSLCAWVCRIGACGKYLHWVHPPNGFAALSGHVQTLADL